jgi:hypothetical protein
MNLKAIRNTAICSYSTEDGGVYIVESPLLEIGAGIAPTESEAWEIFDDLTEAMYMEYLKGKTVARYQRGRPPKGAVHIHVQIRPKTRREIAALGKKLQISQGEAIDYLLAFYKAKSSEPASDNNGGGVNKAMLKKLAKQLEQASSTMQDLNASYSPAVKHSHNGSKKKH